MHKAQNVTMSHLEATVNSVRTLQSFGDVQQYTQNKSSQLEKIIDPDLLKHSLRKYIEKSDKHANKIRSFSQK